MVRLWMKKKDEEKRMEADHQKLVSRMIASDDGGARLAAQDHETDSLERRSAESEGGRRRCQGVRSAEGGTGLLHEITKPTAWRGGVQILKEEEQDARPMDRCEERRKEWARHWHCDANAQN